MRDPMCSRPLSASGLPRGWRLLSLAAVLAPLTVAVQETPPDTSLLRFYVAGGTGSYADVARGCSGQVISSTRRDFSEAGGAADVRAVGPLHLGVRASSIVSAPPTVPSLENVVVWNPYVAVEAEKFAFGFGYIPKPQAYEDGGDFELSPASAHIRIGPRHDYYFSTSLYETVPIYSGGGGFDVGLGFPVARSVDLWLGLGGIGLYDGVGLLLRSEYRLGSHLGFDLKGRLGQTVGTSECAVVLGVSYSFLKHGRRPPPEAPALAPETPPPAASDSVQVR